MDKVVIAREVAEQLWTTEQSIDAALADCAQLVTVGASCRAALNLSSTVDAAAMAKVIEAMQALSAARTAMADAHAELADVQKRMGIRRAQMVGPHKIPTGEAADERTTLQVVGG